MTNFASNVHLIVILDAMFLINTYLSNRWFVFNNILTLLTNRNERTNIRVPETEMLTKRKNSGPTDNRMHSDLRCTLGSTHIKTT